MKGPESIAVIHSDEHVRNVAALAVQISGGEGGAYANSQDAQDIFSSGMPQTVYVEYGPDTISLAETMRALAVEQQMKVPDFVIVTPKDPEIVRKDMGDKFPSSGVIVDVLDLVPTIVERSSKEKAVEDDIFHSAA